MYKAFYGLKESPFSIAPNPDFLFLSDRHREALAHLTYGLGETGGFVLLTGEVGTGKTTVSRCLLRQLPDNTDTAFILNPSLTEQELLATLCDELKIPYGDNPSLKQLTDLISRFLLQNHQAGRNTVMIIDEAQHLRPEVLEQLRLLTNLETDTKKLLQVILIGQPELQQLLKRQELRQLAQRITARYHLLPLTLEEVGMYVQHRLQVAGRFEPLFNRGAIKVLHKFSGGIPRLINLMCERALMAGYARSRVPIDARMVSQAAAEVLGLEAPKPGLWQRPVPIAIATALTFGGALLWLNQYSGLLPGAEAGQQPPVTTQAVVSDTAVETPAAEVVALQPANSIDEAQSERQAQLQAQARVLNIAIDASREIDTAFAALFGAWGAAPYSDLSPCQGAQAQGLSCHQQQGNWFSLTRLNYPAVVYLLDDEGQDFYGTVLARDGDSLLLQLAEQQLWVERDWFNRHFTGTFELFWQAPAQAASDIGRGSALSQIQWLENGLAQLDDRPPRQMQSFDSQLEMRLKQFQRQHGLKADGIAGSQTQVQLNLYLSRQGPRLVSNGGLS
ncbi:ExeA family protein [Shewanella cyperi]|uniref:ExeA family protein n=1 Tax=Shewanella cyperi TaxID=2814292 RepID=UPI001A94FCDD|nr:ExeA family protein [Shewanella cyperi]QSX41567.1 AAA family ATPase [Shewanella cyperi]